MKKNIQIITSYKVLDNKNHPRTWKIGEIITEKRSFGTVEKAIALIEEDLSLMKTIEIVSFKIINKETKEILYTYEA